MDNNNSYARKSRALLAIQRNIPLKNQKTTNAEVEVILSEANTLAVIEVAEQLRRINYTLKDMTRKPGYHPPNSVKEIWEASAIRRKFLNVVRKILKQ